MVVSELLFMTITSTIIERTIDPNNIGKTYLRLLIKDDGTIIAASGSALDYNLLNLLSISISWLD